MSFMEQKMSSPTSEALASWRVFLECALALPDILSAEMEAAAGSRSAGTTCSSTSRRRTGGRR